MKQFNFVQLTQLCCACKLAEPHDCSLLLLFGNILYKVEHNKQIFDLKAITLFYCCFCSKIYSS